MKQDEINDEKARLMYSSGNVPVNEKEMAYKCASKCREEGRQELSWGKKRGWNTQVDKGENGNK